MDGLSQLADWANQNEGLLQALAMLGGIGALLISLRRQQSQAVARSKAVEPVPAKVVVRPVGESRSASLVPVFGGYGGHVTVEDEEIVATFPDADDAARAALEI